jgi:mannose/fructose/N-acetylgalactosamine-specific phosphotransferase system component IID
MSDGAGSPQAIDILHQIHAAITDNTAASRSLAATAGQVAADRLEAENKRSKRLLRAILGVLIVGTVIITVVAVTQRQNKAQVDSTAEATAIIKDCTQPGGECYTRSQVAQAAAVQSIIDQITASNRVADHLLVQELACVIGGRSAADCIAEFDPPG